MTSGYGHAIAIGDRREMSRDEWVAGRSEYIGASEIAAILCLLDSEPGAEEDDYRGPPEALSAYRGPFDVWAVLTGKKQPFAGNVYCAVGNLVEPHIRRWASGRLGGVVEEVHAILRHPECPRMVANLDGWLAAEGVPVELKWFSWRGKKQWQAWQESLEAGATTGEPPMVCQGQSLFGYWIQLQAQLSVTGAPYGYLVGVCSESALYVMAGHDPAPGDQFVVRVERDNDFCAALPLEVARWWAAHVEGDLPPEPSLQDYEAIREVYRAEVAGKVLEAPELAPAVAQYINAHATEKEAKRLKDMAKVTIMAALGDAERAVVPGCKSLTWKRNKNGVRQLRVA